MKNPSPSWRSQVESWYLAYAALGVAVAGMAPILLPLVVSRTGNAADVGLVMAAFSLGGLAAPAWGVLADHRRLHRLLLRSGLGLAGLSLAAFPLFPNVAAGVALALIQSSCAAAAGTVANLFIVELHPKTEWDGRISWLQTFYGGGQCAGLVLAGALTGAGYTMGLIIAGAIAALGLIPAWKAPRMPPSAAVPRPVLRHAARHLDSSAGSPLRSYHYPGKDSLFRLVRSFFSPFGLLLFGWCVSFAGAGGYFALYPIVMQKEFGVAPPVAATGFAVAAGLGLLLYAPSGRWSERWGSLPVLRGGLFVRLFSFIGLYGLGFVHLPIAGPMALGGFLFLVLAWSPLSVAGTAMAAQLSTLGEGEGLGLFNATSAIGGTAGAFLGGVCSEQWGFAAVSMLGILGVGMALIIFLAVPGETRGGGKYGASDTMERSRG